MNLQHTCQFLYLFNFILCVCACVCISGLYLFGISPWADTSCFETAGVSKYLFIDHNQRHGSALLTLHLWIAVT